VKVDNDFTEDRKFVSLCLEQNPMKRVAMSASVIAGLVLTLGGCTSSQSRVEVWTSTEVALALLGPDEERHSHDEGEFRLGAGDNLGRAVYHNYVAIVRANPDMQYASGETAGN
jgi:hypothetical protein